MTFLILYYMIFLYVYIWTSDVFLYVAWKPFFSCRRRPRPWGTTARPRTESAVACKELSSAGAATRRSSSAAAPVACAPLAPVMAHPQGTHPLGAQLWPRRRHYSWFPLLGLRERVVPSVSQLLLASTHIWCSTLCIRSGGMPDATCHLFSL